LSPPTEEYVNLSNYDVFKPVATNSIPRSAKVLSTTWVMKKRPPDDTITARGFEQKDGEHFDSTDKSSPVVNDTTIKLFLTIIVMGGFWIELSSEKCPLSIHDLGPKFSHHNEAIDEEYESLSNYGVFKPVATNSIP
jgi:hypothetical protein